MLMLMLLVLVVVVMVLVVMVMVLLMGIERREIVVGVSRGNRSSKKK